VIKTCDKLPLFGSACNVSALCQGCVEYPERPYYAVDATGGMGAAASPQALEPPPPHPPQNPQGRGTLAHGVGAHLVYQVIMHGFLLLLP
jgi:hypothetical protein